MKAKLNGIEINYEISGKEGAPWLVLQPLARLQRAHVGPADRGVQGQLPHPELRHARPRRDEAPKGAVHAGHAGRRPAPLARRAEDQEHASTVGLSIGGMIGQTLALRGIRASFDKHGARRHHAHAAAGGAQAVGGAHRASPSRRAWPPLLDSTMERWFTPPFRSSPAAKKIARADPADAGGGLRRLRPRHHGTQHHRAAEGHQAAGAGHHRRAGRRGAGHRATSARTCRERSSSTSRRPRTSPTSSSPRPSIALCGSSFHPLPARELRRVDAEEVEDARHAVRHQLLDRLRPGVEGGHRREDRPPPISVAATMLRRCARLSGVSRGTSTRRRRSFSTTSAAREMRSSACACATAASVFIEHGAITMPSVRNEPLAIVAAMSLGW